VSEELQSVFFDMHPPYNYYARVLGCYNGKHANRL